MSEQDPYVPTKEFEKVYRIGTQYTVKATAKLAGILQTTIQARFEWRPNFPGLKLLSQVERGDYIAASHDFSQSIARYYDIDVGEFEIGEV
jgi:hypothetical protein